MATDELFHTVATYKVVNTTPLSASGGGNYGNASEVAWALGNYGIYPLRWPEPLAEESRRVLEEFLCHVRRLNWHVGRIRSDLGSTYVNTKLQPPRRNDATIFEMVKSEFKNLNSRGMARKSMASSSVTTIRWMKWRTCSIMAWWPQISFWKYAYRHLNWIY